MVGLVILIVGITVAMWYREKGSSLLYFQLLLVKIQFDIDLLHMAKNVYWRHTKSNYNMCKNRKIDIYYFID